MASITGTTSYSFSHDPGFFKYERNLAMSSHTPARSLDAVKALTLTDEHLLVISYPKCGQTWTLNMVHLTYNAEDPNNLVHVTTQTPWPTDTVVYPEMQYESGETGTDLFKSGDPRRRVIKSHLPVRFYRDALETSRAKVIHLLRTPLDAIVSYYHFYQANYALGNYKGSWEEFFSMYKNEDFFWGEMLEHAAGWFHFNQSREDSLTIYYEDLRKDLRSSVIKVASFLGRSLSDDVTDLVVEKLTFENMQKDSEPISEGLPRFQLGVEPIVGKGRPGDWREYFTPEQKEYIQYKIDTIATPAGLSFRET